MATVTVSITDLESQFRSKIEMELEIAQLKAKLAALESAPKKAKKPKDPNAPAKPKKSKYATPEELAEARRQNGIRLAAANKAKKEAKKEAEKLDAEWLAAEQAQKSETGSESGESAPSESD
jgi:hypothetical protein